jgi:hypothetical protein
MLHTGIDLQGLFRGRSESERAGTVANICEAMSDPKVPHRDRTRISIKAIYDGLVNAMHQDENLTEAITSGVFLKLNRTQVVDEVMEGYGSVALVGRNLVTPSQQPGKRTGTIARATTTATMEEVLESEEYKAATMSDKSVTFRQRKYGRRIDLTKETIMEDQTGTVLDTARNLGQVGAEWEEEKILSTIQDLTGFKGYNPGGTQTDLFSSTATESTDQTPANNIKASNALADWTDIDNAKQLLASKLKENGKPIATSPNIALLAPVALSGTGGYILKNTADTRANRNANSPREVLALPGGNHYSPFLDVQSVSTWYLGDFKRQFKQTIYWPLQTFFVDGKTDSSMALRDIFGTWVVSIFFDVIATDFRFVVKSTA